MRPARHHLDEEEGGEVGEHNREGRRDLPGEEHGRDTDRDRLGLCLTEGETDGDEVAADLTVDREERRQRVLHGQGARCDLRSHEHTDDLGDRGAGPRIGDRNGRPVMTPSRIRPIGFDASGDTALAMKSEAPVYVTTPMRSETYAMNGRIVFSVSLIAWRPDESSVLMK